MSTKNLLIALAVGVASAALYDFIKGQIARKEA